MAFFVEHLPRLLPDQGRAQLGITLAAQFTQIDAGGSVDHQRGRAPRRAGMERAAGTPASLYGVFSVVSPHCQSCSA